MSIAKAYADIAEGQVHLRRSAPGGESDPPLVLLHASPSSSRSLVSLMEALGPARECIAFDTPANGQSCAPAMPEPEMGDFAAMLARAADALGKPRVALYGTHTGAHIAIEWALARPEAVAALVLDGVALLDEAMRAEFLELYAPRKAPDETGSQFPWAFQFIRDQMIFFPHYRKDAAHIRAGGDLDPRVLHDLALEVLANLDTYHLPYEAVFRHDVRAALARLDLPVLVLADSASALDPASAEVARLVPHARLATDCASPAAKAAAISAFLETLE
ncbi:alpha/beta hydrolase [Erythrobacter sp.]|uniref:alpha/beta fold hydrolase n=1 Tax=Erythrobacter sp. TaxID=1042 RepID=UPI001425C2FE|nr:alpha/beta hydrolase [Erythrobacter sp.]QIQ86492.1 MAG: alpha/beta hydrolase [Erythrobacter sp.]